MENANTSTIAGWFAGRVPDDWFTGAPEVTVEGEQIVVVGRLAEVALGADSDAEVKASAAKGRIARFRGETRRERIWIAREAEGLFKKNVTWGAGSGTTRETFTPGGSGRGNAEKSTEGSVTIGRRHGWGRRFAGPRHTDTRSF